MKLKKYPVSDEQITALLVQEKAAKGKTHPEPGGYAVAALAKDGQIYQGAAYKSETYTLTMHAEAVVLAHTVMHDAQEIVAMTGPNCHACKQLIWERALHTGIDIQIVIMTEQGARLVPISEQMPYPWPDLDGNH